MGPERVKLLRSGSRVVLGGAGKQPGHLGSRGLLGVERGHVGGERKRSRVRLASEKYVPSGPRQREPRRATDPALLLVDGRGKYRSC